MVAIRMVADRSRPRELFDLLCGSRYRWRETLRRFQASDWRCVGLAERQIGGQTIGGNDGAFPSIGHALDWRLNHRWKRRGVGLENVAALGALC